MSDTSSDSFHSALSDGCDYYFDNACDNYFDNACDYYFDNACDQCERECRNVEAKGYCSTCAAYLCQECYTTHLRPKIMRHHVLLDEKPLPDKAQHQSQDACDIRQLLAQPDVRNLLAQYLMDQLPDKAQHQSKDACDVRQPLAQHVIDQLPDKTQHKSKDVCDVIQPLTQFVMDINVRSTNDRDTANIISSVLLARGKLVLVDDNNIKVKLVELAYQKVTAELKLALWISDMAKINDNKVAVMSSKKGMIYVVNVGNELTLDNIVDVKGQCKGIACINGKFVLTFDDPVRVEIVSNTGQLIKILVSAHTGGQLFGQLRHIAMDNDRGIFHISDLAQNAVISLNYSGTVKRVYEDSNLMSPHKLAVKMNGEVFVCGYESNNIHKIDLSKKEIILEKADGVTRPQTISCCDLTGNLYIGMWRSDILKVYQLKEQNN